MIINNTANGDIDWSNTDNKLTAFTVASGTTATITATLSCQKATVNASGELAGTGILYLYTPTSNDFLDMAGTISATIDVLIYFPTSNLSNLGAIKAQNLTLETTNDTLTQTGAITITSALSIRGVNDTEYGKVVIGVGGCTLGAVTL